MQIFAYVAQSATAEMYVTQYHSLSFYVCLIIIVQGSQNQIELWKCAIEKNWVLLSHSVEISWFLYHPDFTWNQFCGFLKCKSYHFNTFRGSEFWRLYILVLFEACNLPKIKIQSPKNVEIGRFTTSRILKIDFT